MLLGRGFAREIMHDYTKSYPNCKHHVRETELVYISTLAPIAVHGSIRASGKFAWPERLECHPEWQNYTAKEHRST
jgi:hypothetical protein